MLTWLLESLFTWLLGLIVRFVVLCLVLAVGDIGLAKGHGVLSYFVLIFIRSAEGYSNLFRFMYAMALVIILFNFFLGIWRIMLSETENSPGPYRLMVSTIKSLVFSMTCVPVMNWILDRFGEIYKLLIGDSLGKAFMSNGISAGNMFNNSLEHFGSVLGKEFVHTVSGLSAAGAIPGTGSVNLVEDAAMGIVFVILLLVAYALLLCQLLVYVINLAERLLLVCLLYTVAPLCLATGNNPSTESISKAFIRTFISQLIVLVASHFFLLLIFRALTAPTAVASTFGETDFATSLTPFGAVLLVAALAKIGNNIDGIAGKLGLSTVSTGGGLLGEQMGAVRQTVGMAGNPLAMAAAGAGTYSVLRRQGNGVFSSLGHAAFQGATSGGGALGAIGAPIKQTASYGKSNLAKAINKGTVANNQAQNPYGMGTGMAAANALSNKIQDYAKKSPKPGINDDLGQAQWQLAKDLHDGNAVISDTRIMGDGSSEGKVTYKDGSSYNFKADKSGKIIPSSVSGEGASSFYRASMDDFATTRAEMARSGNGTTMLACEQDANGNSSYRAYTNLSDENGKTYTVSQDIASLNYNNDGTASALNAEGQTIGTFSMTDDGHLEYNPTACAANYQAYSEAATQAPNQALYLGNTDKTGKPIEGQSQKFGAEDQYKDIGSGGAVIQKTGSGDANIIMTTSANSGLDTTIDDDINAFVRKPEGTTFDTRNGTAYRSVKVQGMSDTDVASGVRQIYSQNSRSITPVANSHSNSTHTVTSGEKFQEEAIKIDMMKQGKK